MTKPLSLALCALALTVPGGRLLRAEPDVPAATGHVLVLANERTLEGDIERHGDQYRVRRTIGETWLPGDQVLCLCANLEEAFAFLRQRANLRDPDERLRLARWCVLHGLKDHALAEAAEAVALRPSHAESQRLLRGLQQAATLPPPAQAAQPRDDPDAARNSLVPADFNSDALGPFVTRVQPILMNTCACCHATGRGGSFKLLRVYQDGSSNHRATQLNLAAVLATINREQPSASPLLSKSVTAHGGAGQPPLKGRQTPAYRNLEEWVHLAVSGTQAPAVSMPVAVLPAADPKPEAMPARPMPASPVPAKAPPVQPAEGFASQATEPAAPAEPVDPFDPMIFNRQMHPAPRPAEHPQ